MFLCTATENKFYPPYYLRRMTKQMQEIQNDFLEKFPELKEFPALAMEMQTFLHQACTRYAQGIVPEKLQIDPKRKKTYELGGDVGWNQCIEKTLHRIHIDSKHLE